MYSLWFDSSCDWFNYSLFELGSLFSHLAINFLFIYLVANCLYRKSLKKFLLKRHELPHDYVDPDQVKRQRTKGFRDR